MADHWCGPFATPLGDHLRAWPSWNNGSTMSERPMSRRPEALVDLSSPRRCHLVGVGGPGMSAIAMLLVRMGHTVAGSELKSSTVTRQLIDAGVTVHADHSASHVAGADVVVYSTAIAPDHVELVAARERSIPVRHRSGMLASICAIRRAVGVAGTHGKTTTTALLVHMLRAGGLDPSAIIGAEVNGIGVGALVGSGDILVIEADESDGTLDVLPFHGLVVTNADRDHLDYFGSLEAIQHSFSDAVARTSGPVVLNRGDVGSSPVVSRFEAEARVSTFGTDDDATMCVAGFSDTVTGLVVSLRGFGESVDAQVPLRGRHNAENVAAATCMAVRLGVPFDVAAGAIRDFPGVARRFTERGMHRGALLVDDYAHLPAEIAATLAAATSHPHRTGKLVAVFQPNRFHRVATMSDDYADCFASAHTVVITEIYASGTEPIPGVSGIMVHDAVLRAHPDARVLWAPHRADVVSVVDGLLEPGDMCVSMGCGDIETFPDDLRASSS